MAKKIYLSPSDQYRNTYFDGKHNEGEVCHSISGATEIALERSGVPVKRGKTGSISERVKQSNSWGADLHVCIHTNAGGGDGSLVMCYPGNKNEAIVKNMYNKLAKMSPGKDDGIKEVTNLYEINNSKALCVYIEIAFHDNSKDGKWILENEQKIGEAIAEAICDTYGYKYVAKNETSDDVSRETLYKVQVGAFSEKKNAEKLASELASKGYSTYIVN